MKYVYEIYSEDLDKHNNVRGGAPLYSTHDYKKAYELFDKAVEEQKLEKHLELECTNIFLDKIELDEDGEATDNFDTLECETIYYHNANDNDEEEEA